MKNNLPIKKENNFLSKIKNFFRRLFVKKDPIEITNNIDEKMDISNQQDKQSFGDDIKISVFNDYLNDFKRTDFINKIEKNPDLLYNISIDRLKKLENYYDYLIAKDIQELNKIKKAI